MSLVKSILAPSVSGILSSIIPTSGAAVVYDWLNWNNTNDGAVTNIRTGGDIGAQDIAAVDDSEAVIVYEDGADSDAWKCAVLDNDGKVLKDVNTAITITGAGQKLGQLLQRLSDTKFLAVCEATNALAISLITKSGKTLTQADSDSLTDKTYNFRHSLKNLDADNAIYFGKNDANSNTGVMCVINTASDTLTVGARLETGESVLDYPDCTRAASGAFWAVDQRRVRYCTYDGSFNITEQANLSLVAAGTVFDDTMCVYIDDATCLVSYEKVSDSQFYANVFTWDGSSITRHTEVSDIFDGTDGFQGTGTSAELGNRQGMFSTRLDDIAGDNGGQVVLSVADDNTITVGTRYSASANVIADHNVISATPSGKYVYYAYQDETTTPIKQIGTRVLEI